MSQIEQAIARQEEARRAKEDARAAELQDFRRLCRSLGYGLRVCLPSQVTPTDKAVLAKFDAIVGPALNDAIQAQLIELGMAPDAASKIRARIRPVLAVTKYKGETFQPYFALTISGYGASDLTPPVEKFLSELRNVNVGTCRVRTHAVVKMSEEIVLDNDTKRINTQNEEAQAYAIVQKERWPQLSYSRSLHHDYEVRGYMVTSSEHFLLANNLVDMFAGINSALSEPNRIDSDGLLTELNQTLWQDHRLLERAQASASTNQDFRELRDRLEDIADYAIHGMCLSNEAVVTLVRDLEAEAVRRGISLEPIIQPPIDLNRYPTIEALNPTGRGFSARAALQALRPETSAPLYRAIAAGQYQDILDRGIRLQVSDYMLGLKEGKPSVLDLLIRQGYMPELLDLDHWDEWDDFGHLLVAANAPESYLTAQTGETYETLAAKFKNRELGSRIKALHVEPSYALDESDTTPAPESSMTLLAPVDDPVESETEKAALLRRIQELEGQVAQLSGPAPTIASPPARHSRIDAIADRLDVAGKGGVG